MDKGTTLMVTGGATGVGAAQLEPAKSILDVPLWSVEFIGQIAEISSRDILTVMGICIALVGVGLKVYEKVKSNGNTI